MHICDDLGWGEVTVLGRGGGGEGDFAVGVSEEGFDLCRLLRCGCEGALLGWAVRASVGGGGDGLGDWFGHAGCGCGSSEARLSVGK